jgi:hypothetical protein
MVLLAIVILVSGAAIGSGVMVLVLKDRMVRPPSPGEKAADQITADMHARYRLTDEQDGKVHEILARRMTALETIREDAQEKMAAEHDKLRAEIKAVLTPEQFEQWAARFDAMRPPPFGGPPHGPPGGPPPGGERPMPGGPPGAERPMQGGPPPQDFRPPPGRKEPGDRGPHDRGPGGDRPPPDAPGDHSKEPSGKP